jgi:hypothetical protein
VIHDETGSIERISAISTPSQREDAPERVLGSSSASCFGETVVTTCALVEDPTVLSVSLVQGADSPEFIELDLSETTVFGVPSKIQCFEDHSTWILRMVDSKGIIISLTLDSTWTPTSFTLLSIPELLEAQHGFFSGAELDSSMVLFLSSTVLVMGLSPHLLTVHLDSQKLVIWSETQTLEDMRSRRGLGRILNKASELLLGKQEGDGTIDMPPTAALCHASEGFIFTLHSDASVRLWHMHDLRPIAVVPLALPQDAIPEPAMWSDSQGAVALCAQLYESVYALAIHIQTVGGDDGTSACQLTVVYGPQDLEQEDPVRSTLQLSVPATATSLVGFDFARERCRLTALFQSQENEATSALLVTYPHSIVSIVSTQPVVTPHEYTLDGVAASERARLSALSFSTTGTSLEEDLHALDSAFLKHLFRPAYPRGNGSVTSPLPSCIRAAIRKLVPGHYEGEGMTIELETLRAMHEWRRLENRGIQTPARRTECTVVATPGASIYDRYAEEEPDTPEMEIDDIEEEDEDDLLDQERAALLESHEQRWKTLVLTIWEEEARMREPLCLTILLSAETSTTFVLVRAGVTSLLEEVVIIRSASSKWEELDEAAMILLGLIEKSEEKSLNLLSIETRVYEEIAKASLVFTGGDLLDCANHLFNLGKWALSQADDSEVNPDDLASALNESSRDDILVWLQSVDSLFYLDLPGASVLPDGADVIGDDPNETWNNRIAHVQSRHAACSLYLRCSDSVRRLRLSRVLLLSSINGSSFDKNGPIFEAVFREYLHSISVLWSCPQLVPMPTIGFHGRTRAVDFGSRNDRSSPSEPDPKRLSFGENTSSILAYYNRANLTTALDARLIQISQAHSNDTFGTSSPDGVVVALARICFDSTFAAAPSSALLELGALLAPSDQSVASDHPRIALRLLAPFFVYPPINEDEEVVLARKEALAECLLIEANAASQKTRSDSNIDVLRTKACDLLVPVTNEIAVDHRLLETVFVTLRKQRKVMPSSRQSTLEEMERNEEALANELQLLLNGTPCPAGTDVKRLCQQPTLRWLFLPLLSTEHRSFFRSLDDLPRDYVKMTAEVLLRISNLLHRLSLLERHTGSVGSFVSHESSESVVFLLGYIENAITEIQKLLPMSVYSSMTEYARLWTMLFHHSVSARRWMTAHSACIGHPVPERRISCYKRLVIAMADAGAFAELIDLCSLVAYNDSNELVEYPLVGGGDCVDLYEIAAETLGGSKQRDLYSTDSVVGSTDYLGCLYALHISRGHWKRAAQAMDAKYVIASKALSSSGDRDVRLANTVNVTAALDDLALTSLSCSNAVQLIEDPSLRFLVSGELGPYPILPIMTDAVTEMATGTDVKASNTGTKRGRSGRSGVGWTPRRVVKAESGGAGDASRLSRFMTVVDLNARAVRAIALRTIRRDHTSESPVFSPLTSLSPSVDADHSCMDHLWSLGYFDRAILLAKTMQTQYEERNSSTNPAGRSLLHDSISRLLTFYILPVAMNLASIPSEYGMDTDEVMSRPTLSQLRRAIEECGDMVEHTFSFTLGETWYPKVELPVMVRASTAMELTQKLTTVCTSATSPIALEVAEALLDLDQDRSSLPLWLERLLLGVTGVSDAAGLFSKRQNGDATAYNGDPTGLLGLYMKRGMYIEACGVVSGVLTGSVLDGDGTRSRESRAPARLPEKGDIDFVPYDKIDVLWNLVHHACSNHLIDSREKKKLQESKDAMEKALEKHFELMGISEQGARSARALSSN